MKNNSKQVWTEMSQEEVAKVMGISRTRVYQIEKSALKIKTYIKNNQKLLEIFEDLL